MVPKTRLKGLLIILLTIFLGQSCAGITSPYPAQTPQATIETATPIPPGIFTLLFYSPLSMVYDASEWRMDKAGSLQALSVNNCQLGEIGPSGNFPLDTETVQLGHVEYLFSLSQISTPGMTAGLYIENQSVAGYDYDIGLPVLMVLADRSRWDECKTLAEEVLSTLRVP